MDENGFRTQGITRREVDPFCGEPAQVAANDISKWHSVVVNKVANGFILKIGCSTFVAKNWEEASAGIAEYWKDPIAAQKKYCS